MKKGVIFIVCLLLSNVCLADAEADLIGKLEKIQSFKASFKQHIKDASGQSIARSKGKVLIKRPGKFYWKSQAPDPVLVVADGRFVWTYDEELSQVTKQKQKAVFANSPASLLAGDLSYLHNTFKTDYAKTGCSGEKACFVLTPLEKDSNFADIVIQFSQNKLDTIKMLDPLGQQVDTHFSNVQLNTKMDPKHFSFVPPKGVDVISA